MIIYGTKTTQLAKESLIDKCRNCGTINSIDMYIFQTYAHIFWIPFFPLSKTGVSQCDHCHQVLKLKEMHPALKESYETVKANTKTPIWVFSGVGVVLLIITISVFASKKNDETNAAFITNPKVGDILEVKTPEKQYTLYKVDQVEGDSVLVRMNNYETDQISGLDDLKRKADSSYSESDYGFSRSELKQMLKKGEIIDVDRERKSMNK